MGRYDEFRIIGAGTSHSASNETFISPSKMGSHVPANKSTFQPAKKRIMPTYHHFFPCQLPTCPETQHRSWAHHIYLYCIGQNIIRRLDPTCWKAEECCKGENEAYFLFRSQLIKVMRLGSGIWSPLLYDLPELTNYQSSPRLFCCVFPHNFPW